MLVVGDTGTEKGSGLFTTGPLPLAEVLGRFEGELYHSSDYLEMEEDPDPGNWLQTAENLYLGPSEDFASYANHSCSPNCGILQYSPEEVHLVTIRPVEAGEELVWDYSTSMAETGPERWVLDPCLCGAPNCRGAIDQFNTLSPELQEKYRKIGIVPPFVSDHRKEARMKTAELKTTYQGEGRYQENQHLTKTEEGTIPLIVAVQLPGKKGEQREWYTEDGERYFGNYPEEEWLEFVEDVKTRGIINPIFIVVEWVGSEPKASVYEGNHRIQAAKFAGLDEIPVEVKYFGHAEEEFEWPRRHLDRLLRHSNSDELNHDRDAGSQEIELERLFVALLPGTKFANKVFAVGGYVRDLIQGRDPADLDVAVELPYGAQRFAGFLMDTFPDVLTHPEPLTYNYPIWFMRFTKNVEWEGESYAVEGAELDLTDTQTVFQLGEELTTRFGPLHEDVLRRDFTVNMLYKDLTSGEIIDPTGTGKSDIELGLLRVRPDADAAKSFREQPRRMLRLIRFMVQYDWQPDSAVEAALIQEANSLEDLSQHSLEKELGKLERRGLLTKATEIMRQYGLLEPLQKALRREGLSEVTALVSTKSDLATLTPKVESKLENLAGFITLFEAYTDFYNADGEVAEELADRINALDPNHKYADRGEVVDDFHDEVFELQKLLRPEIKTLVEWSNQLVSRPEEARKFTLMRNNIKRIENFTNLADRKWEYLSPYDGDAVLKLLVKHTLKPLQYIAKYWHRLERYQTIERNVKHGPFTLVNEYGYAPEEYSKALNLLDEAAQKISAKGFDEILYGEVIMTTERAMRKFHGRAKDVVGVYYSLDDNILLAVDYQGSEGSAAPILIHEFGHRLWRKVLTPQQKKRHIHDFGWLTSESVKSLWGIMEKANYNIWQAIKMVEGPEVVAELRARWKRATQSTAQWLGIRIKPMLQYIREGDKNSQFELRDRFIKNYGEFTKPKSVKVRPKSVTSYGRTNPEEDFCDTFMFYCMGWKILPSLEARFLNTLE